MKAAARAPSLMDYSFRLGVVFLCIDMQKLAVELLEHAPLPSSDLAQWLLRAAHTQDPSIGSNKVQ